MTDPRTIPVTLTDPDTEMVREALEQAVARMIDPEAYRQRWTADKAATAMLQKAKQEHATHIARAVVALVLEEAAKVADSLHYPDETKISASIRDAIRALIPESPE